MIDFFIKVPEEKAEFFSQLMDDLGYEYNKLLFSEDSLEDDDSEEIYFTDSDD